MEDRRFVIKNNQSGKRIDIFLSSKYKGEMSRTKIKNLIIKGKVLVNGKTTIPHYILKEKDKLFVRDINQNVKVSLAQNIPLDIIYEDNDIIVINKQPGLVVHPGAGNMDNTLVNALHFHTKGHLSKYGGDIRAGIVHRLDKDTSGLIVAAKNDKAHAALSEQFKNHSVNKIYTVIVKGIIQHDEGKCDQPIGRGRVFRKKMVVLAPEGKEALSEYTVIKRFTNATLVKVKIHTGRTHQIRVHMAYMGYPVIGDRQYGVRSALISRQCIHAGYLDIIHPKSGKRILFEAPLPDDMECVLEKLSL